MREVQIQNPCGCPGAQERRGRVKAAEMRREEAEQTGEPLQHTSCDSITQVCCAYGPLECPLTYAPCAAFLHYNLLASHVEGSMCVKCTMSITPQTCRHSGRSAPPAQAAPDSRSGSARAMLTTLK